jgi:hypothetical protein
MLGKKMETMGEGFLMEWPRPTNGFENWKKKISC